jgi:hypothetical protein
VIGAASGMRSAPPGGARIAASGARFRTFVAAFAVLGLGALAGCSGSDKVEAVTLQARIDVIEAEVRTRIGPAACTSDGECRVLPMGALACGGPASFVPYSIRATDEGALGRLSADHQALSAEQLKERAAVGTCIALQVPAAYCELSAPLSCKTR